MGALILHGIGGYGGIHWQQWLRDKLTSKGYNVFMPSLSESEHPDRHTWLEQTIQIVGNSPTENLIIIGNSLGVTTALDFIETLSSPIKALICVSGFSDDYGADFNSYFLREKVINFDKVRRNVRKCTVIYGDDDPYVTQEALSSLAQNLKVEATVIHNGGHLNTEAGFIQFPVLLHVINDL